MKMPKYKPTKWKIDFCLECKTIVHRNSYTCIEKHEVVRRENIPFYVPDMRIISIGYHGWANLKSEKMKASFQLSPSNLETIILKYVIGPKGALPDRWWMCVKSVVRIH